MFPNEHSVYLHDTPARALFEKTVRAFSSGCIRIENPLELAALLLDDREHWSQQQLRGAIATGKTETVPVRRTVPVMLLYFTASAAGDGELQFRPDLYNRDGPIVRALAAPFRFAAVDAGTRGAAGK
jgi:murein L,D-transpeptidase YcbB/YkuD